MLPAKNRVVGLLFRVLFVLAIIHVAVLSTGNRPLKIGFCCIEIIIMLLISGYRIVNRGIKASYFAMIATVAFIMVWNCIADNVNIKFEIIVNLLCLLVFMISISTCDMVVIDESAIEFLRKCILLLSATVIVLSQMPFAHSYNGRTIRALTLGFTNPNLTGMYLFLLFGMLLVVTPSKKNLLYIVCQGVILYLLWLTESRAAIISAFALIIVRLFLHRNIPMYVVGIACAFPFVYIVGYLWLYEKGVNIDILGETIFTGRQDTFAGYLEKINSFGEYLFGSFEHSILENGHNAPLSIFTSIGILGAFAVYFILIKSLFKSARKSKSSVSRVAICVLLCCFILSSNEAFLFLGEYPGVIFMYTFYVFANSDLNFETRSLRKRGTQ